MAEKERTGPVGGSRPDDDQPAGHTSTPTIAEHLYDADAVVCFGNARPVVAVDPDGTLWPWLLGRRGAPQGCCCADCAPHEQTGPLPQHVRARLNQCGAIGSTTRRRCNNQVKPPGRYCHQHRGDGGDGG